MSTTKAARPKEGLVVYRWLMVTGSLAPLFVLLAIRGTPKVNNKALIPDSYFVILCLLFAVIPTMVIVWRLWKAIKGSDTRTLIAGSVTDSREHLLVYLFALVLPLYQNSYGSMRDLWAAIVLLLLIVFILFHLNLHYMNILFAFFGYRVYTIEAESDENRFSGEIPFVVLSKRHCIPKGAELQVYRISDTVYIEYEE